MKTKLCALLLAAALLAGLAGCGAPRTGRETPADKPAVSTAAPQEEPAAPLAPEPPRSVEASFPLLAAPFSGAESEAMVNHNARRCALMVVNYYYCRCLYADGSRALVRYEIVDNVLRHRTRLAADCPADFLTESDGRLYYLGSGSRPESVSVDGSGRRTELDEPCLSLQLRGGALYCLRTDGTLLALRGGGTEALLGGCSWAFVSEQGIFYTAAADGRAHFFDPAARTDVTLTAAAAQTPTVIGSTFYYAAEEPDGRHLCALELSDGTHRRMEAAFSGEADFLRDWDGLWRLRLTALGGAAGQQSLSLASAFDASPAAERCGDGMLRRCRGVDDVLYTDELFSPDGTALGFELVLPGGFSIPSLAADNRPEK